MIGAFPSQEKKNVENIPQQLMISRRVSMISNDLFLGRPI
jgi:hypothetical protein